MNAHDGGDHERDRQRGEKRRQKAEARHRNLQLTTPGTARLNGSIRASKVSPLSVFIVYVPCIDPKDVRSGQKLVYSNDSPGLRIGCSPTTPGPMTRSVLPSESVMTHSRLMSCAVSLPSFSIVTR